ncbi:MAG: DMT family transporter [Polyangiaceae bacterium]|nr:DMT family transporter [Polyangiaceae bacterium]
MIGATFAFAAMGVAAKLAYQRLPWHEVAAGRAGFGALAVWLWARSRGISLRVHDRGTQWRRTLAGTLALWCGFYALSVLPLGDAVTLSSLGPIFVAALSPWLLRERPGARVWAPLLLAFAGTACIAGVDAAGSAGRPLGVAAGLGGALAGTLAMIYLRRLGPSESAEGVSLHFMTWAAILTGAIGLGHHVVPGPAELALLALAGAAGALGQVMMTHAYGLDLAARVSALGYAGIVVNLGLAVALLGERPTKVQLVGSALVLVAGLGLAGLGAWRSPRAAPPGGGAAPARR